MSSLTISCYLKYDVFWIFKAFAILYWQSEDEEMFGFKSIPLILSVALLSYPCLILSQSAILQSLLLARLLSSGGFFGNNSGQQQQPPPSKSMKIFEMITETLCLFYRTSNSRPSSTMYSKGSRSMAYQSSSSHSSSIQSDWKSGS